MLIQNAMPEPLMLMPPAPLELYFCRGCKRHLPYDEMGKDRSKPNGVHSRCLICKRDQHQAVKQAKNAPAPPVDPAAAIRRDALLELVKRHRLEFDDLIAYYRSRQYGVKHAKGWINLSSAISN